MPLVDAIIQTAPDSAGRVMVTVAALDPEQEIGPCPVMPRGSTLPAGGERALVELDGASDRSWVVAWEPTA